METTNMLLIKNFKRFLFKVTENSKTIEFATCNDIKFKYAKVAKLFFKNASDSIDTLTIVLSPASLNQTYQTNIQKMCFFSAPLHDSIALSYSSQNPDHWDFCSTSGLMRLDELQVHVYQGSSLLSDVTLTNYPLIFEITFF